MLNYLRAFNPPVYQAAPAPAPAPEPEECSVCLCDLKGHPSENEALVKLVAQTDCHHFFHYFCLNEHLNLAQHKECPLCRHPLEDKNIIAINPDDLPMAPAQPAIPQQQHNIPPQQGIRQAEHAQNQHKFEDMIAYRLAYELGKATLYVAGVLAGAGWRTTMYVGTAALSGFSDFLMSKIAPLSQEIETNRLRKINQTEIVNQLRGFNQVLSEIQYRNRIPIESLRRKQELLSEAIIKGGAYLQKIDTINNEMQRVVRRIVTHDIHDVNLMRRIGTRSLQINAEELIGIELDINRKQKAMDAAQTYIELGDSIRNTPENLREMNALHAKAIRQGEIYLQQIRALNNELQQIRNA